MTKELNRNNLAEVVTFCLIFSILDNYQEVIDWMNEKQKCFGSNSAFDLLQSGDTEKVIGYAKWLTSR